MPRTTSPVRYTAPFIRALGTVCILGAVALALLVSSGTTHAASRDPGLTHVAAVASDDYAGSEMISPTPGSAFTSDQVRFSWSAVSGINRYWLEVGTFPSGRNLFGQPMETWQTEFVVSSLPTQGQPLYVRLWTQFTDMSWVYKDYAYTAYTMPNFPAVMNWPAPGSVLTDSTVTFQWDRGGNVKQYWLEVGTSLGASNIFGNPVGQRLNYDVPGIPEDGATIFVRLWTQYDTDYTWQYHDYRYTAHVPVDGSAELTSPTPDSTLSSGFVTFQWTPGTNVHEYRLQVGAANPGDTDYGDFDTTTQHSTEVGPIPVDGRPLNVRLWSRLDAGWTQRDYRFAAATLDPAVLTTSDVWHFPTVFTWTAGTDVLEYKIDVGRTQAANDLVSASTGTARTYTYDRTPTDSGYLWIRIWSRFASGWAVQDSRFDTLDITEAAMTAPAAGSTLSGGTATFSWAPGDGADQYRLDVGTAAGGTDLYTYTGTARTQAVSGLPTSGTIYVRLWTNWQGLGWTYDDYTYTGAP